MDIKEKLNNLGGSVAVILCEGITFYAVGFRSTDEVDLYDCEGSQIGNVTLDDDIECAIVTINGREGAEASRDLYWENTGKMEQDLAEDVGQWLAAISFNL